MKTYIFGYGSLISAASASRALQREITLEDMKPAVVKGYKRTWTLREQVFSESLGKTVSAAFLDLTAAASSWVNGVLFEVSEDERLYLQNREKNYNEVDITSFLQAPGIVPPGHEVRAFTFIAKPEYQVKQTMDDLYVMEKYLQLVAAACAAFGPQFEKEYAASTEEIRFPVLAGNYTFVDLQQRKYV